MTDSLLLLQGFGRRFPGGAGVGPIDADAYAEACAKAGLTVRHEDDLRVLAPSPDRLLAVARTADCLVMKAVPEERGVEEAILAHMEAA